MDTEYCSRGSKGVWEYEKNEKEQQVESYQTVYRGGMGEIIEKKLINIFI